MKIRLVEMTGYDPGSSSLKVYRFCTGTGFSTSPTDTPANTYYEPRVKQPGLFKQFMYTEGATSGSSKGGYGEIVHINVDGGLDPLLDIGFDGQLIVVKEGDDSQPLSAFSTIITGTCEQLATSWDKITVRLRDNSALFNTPAQLTKYLGNNALPAGVEGTSDLKNKPKPRLLGAAINMTPPCVNTSLLIYQTSEKGLLAVPTVYDGGVVITVGISRADVTALSSNAPAAGSFDYILGDANNPSYFRLGSSPAFGITFDGTGIGGQTVGQLCKTLAIEKVGSTKIVEQSIIDLDKASTAQVGFYTGIEEITTSAILDALCASVGAWWGFDNLGMFWCKQLQAPIASQALNTLTQNEIESIERVATNDGDRGVPPWKVTVQYARNFTVQSSGVAGIIGVGDILTAEATQTPLSVDRATRLMMEYFSTSASDSTVQTVHALAPEISIKTLLANKTDADAEALRLLNMRKVRRDRIKVKVPLQSIQYPAGGYWDGEAISNTPENCAYFSYAVYDHYFYMTANNINGPTWGKKLWRLDLNNPAGAWENTGYDLDEYMYNCGFVLVGSKFYLVGGVGSTSGSPSKKVKCIDLANLAAGWNYSAITDLTFARSGCGVVHYNGYIYLIGGGTGSGTTNTVHRFNLSTPAGAWDTSTCQNFQGGGPNFSQGFRVVMCGSVCFLVGDERSVTCLKVDLSNPANAWGVAFFAPYFAKGYPYYYANYVALAVNGNELFVLGGSTYAGATRYFVSINYSTATTSSNWVDLADMPYARHGGCAFYYKDSLYIVGGFGATGSDRLDSTWRLRKNSNPSDISQLTSLGRTILVKHPRYGYSAGRPMRIIGTETNYENNSITLDLWG